MCGIFGIYGRQSKDAARLTSIGLHALQHRGLESAGMTWCNRKGLETITGMGLVSQAFNPKIITGISSYSAIGHVRYSTQGSSELKNAQPFQIRYKGRDYAIAHNGNLVNVDELTRDLEDKGSIFQRDVDTERILHSFARSKRGTTLEKIVEAVDPDYIKGAYSLLFMTEDAMYAVRDPEGIRPLCLGRMEDGAYVVASETYAFDLIGAEFEREIKPGEIMRISKNGIQSITPFKERVAHPCIFEDVYFARPDSYIFGGYVYESRMGQGAFVGNMVKESGIPVDFVFPIPDSGVYGALGFSHETGIKYHMPLVRNNHSGRSFIQATQALRELVVAMKLNGIKKLMKGKDIFFIEDSIISGTTLKILVKAMRKAGPNSIGGGSCFPPVTDSCYCGMDFPYASRLIAHRHRHDGIEGIKEELGLDHLIYNTKEGLLNSVGYIPGEKEFCYQCIGGPKIFEPPKTFSNRK